jgi:hypothetical protein
MAYALSLSTCVLLSLGTDESKQCDDNELKLTQFLSRCNIDKVSLLSLDKFERVYNRKKPVIVQGGEDSNAHFRKMVQKENLLADFGKIEVMLGSANAYTKGVRKATLSEYVHNIRPHDLSKSGKATEYLFGNTHGPEWDTLLKHYTHPPLERASGDYTTLSYGMGGKFSGVPFHGHGPGWSEVLIGAKHWFLYPPKVPPPEFDPDQAQVAWYRDVYPRVHALPSNISASANTPSFGVRMQGAPPISYGGARERITQKAKGNEDGEVDDEEPLPLPLHECTIGPGDLLYFPAHWQHATLNLGDYNVFVSAFT